MPRHSSINARGQPPKFDPRSFCVYMNVTGWPYRNQAMGLIRICLLFSQAAEQSFTQDTALKQVLQACDLALSRAAKAKGKNSRSDEAIERAMTWLKNYDEEFHKLDNMSTFEKDMKDAKESDKAKPAKIKSYEDPLSKVVEFQIMHNLTDPQPAIVRQVLRNDSKLHEVFWNFSRFDDETKCLTLSQNAHFYNHLPTAPIASQGEFRIKATMENWHTCHPEPIRVLTNTVGRVFLELDRPPRAFDVLDMNETLIFKSVCGELQGEGVVKTSILESDPYSWFHVEPLSSQSRVEATVDPPDPVTSPTESSACVPVKDWGITLRQALHSPNFKILIKRCCGCTESSVVAYTLTSAVSKTLDTVKGFSPAAETGIVYENDASMFSRRDANRLGH